MKKFYSFKKLDWKLGKLPNKTAIFAIGDIHGEYKLLDKMLREVYKEIIKLPKLVKKEIILIGDYIDRGLNSKKTISKLIELKIKYKKYKNININYLCGNHDEFFAKLINSNGIIKEPKENECFKIDPLKKLIKSSTNCIYITGLKAWFIIGGGKTTIRDYCPEIVDEMEILILRNKDDSPEKYIRLSILIHTLNKSIPENHKLFFQKITKIYYLIIGQYLFVHAGINPKKGLRCQGIGNNIKNLKEYNLVELLMIRDPFLWIDKLDNCPFYVIHGHTPSEKLKNNIIIADGEKKFRLCLDSKVYDEKGSLTCFFKYLKINKFISVTKKNPKARILY